MTSEERLVKHRKYCLALKPQGVRYPEPNTFLKFDNYKATYVQNYIIVADTETRNVLVRNSPQDKESPPIAEKDRLKKWCRTVDDNNHILMGCQKCQNDDIRPCSEYMARNQIMSRLEVVAYAYRIIPYYTHENFDIRVYVGDDAKDHMFTSLKRDCAMLQDKIQKNHPCVMTEEEKISWEASTHCVYCKIEFPKKGDPNYRQHRRVRNHLHCTGRLVSYSLKQTYALPFYSTQYIPNTIQYASNTQPIRTQYALHLIQYNTHPIRTIHFIQYNTQPIHTQYAPNTIQYNTYPIRTNTIFTQYNIVKCQNLLNLTKMNIIFHSFFHLQVP